MRLIPRRPNRALARDIETERLWLRSLGPLRAVLLVAPWRHDPEMMAGVALHAGKLSLWGWLRRFRRPNNVNRFSYAIVPKGHERPIGLIAVRFRPDGSAISLIGIADPAWRGHQVSIEARSALLTLFFANGVPWFECHIDSRNFASIFVHKRLGFRFVEGPEDTGVDRATGRTIQRLHLVLTRDEWDQRGPKVTAAEGAAHAP